MGLIPLEVGVIVKSKMVKNKHTEVGQSTDFYGESLYDHAGV